MLCQGCKAVFLYWAVFPNNNNKKITMDGLKITCGISDVIKTTNYHVANAFIIIIFSISKSTWTIFHKDGTDDQFMQLPGIKVIYFQAGITLKRWSSYSHLWVGTVANNLQVQQVCFFFQFSIFSSVS